jgi:hypothetical protein
MMQAYYLRDNYKKNLVPGKEFRKFGAMGLAYWYVCEMQARGAYYLKCFNKVPNITFHQADLESIVKPPAISQLFQALDLKIEKIVIPPKANQTENFFFGEKEETALRNMLKRIEINPDNIAEQYIQFGRRLG